jgi:hypothetical protein
MIYRILNHHMPGLLNDNLSAGEQTPIGRQMFIGGSFESRLRVSC